MLQPGFLYQGTLIQYCYMKVKIGEYGSVKEGGKFYLCNHRDSGARVEVLKVTSGDNISVVIIQPPVYRKSAIGETMTVDYSQLTRER